MDWLQQQIEQLAITPICGYYKDSPAATEPTAWTALALAGTQKHLPVVRQVSHWLAGLQTEHGSIGVSPKQATPQWPTSLAVLVWMGDDPVRWKSEIQAATEWILSSFARTYDFQDKLVGHDTTIPAWSWVEDTHCWVEPTSFHIVALTALGKSQHQRTLDGIRMLLNRQMPNGGCNYGNTSVLGQPLVAHVMPSSYSLIALSQSAAKDNRVLRSLAYLRQQLELGPTSLSLSTAMIALASHGSTVERPIERLKTALYRSTKSKDSNYKRAMAVLAAQGSESKFLQLMRQASRERGAA